MDNAQKQKELKQEELKVEVVQEQQEQQEQQGFQFDQLETYQRAEGESLEQAKAGFMEQALTRQAEINESLRQSVQKNVQQNKVTQTAPVNEPPVQEQRARETWKQRRERQSKVRKARRVCPIGNEHTLEISQSIKEYDRSLENALSYAQVNEKRAMAVKADRRALKVFCNGFRLKKDGEPVEEDLEQANQDTQFIEDYLSGNQERRKPHLDRITQEIISMEFTPEMVTPEYIARNAVQLSQMGNRMIYFENIMKENPWYFDNLPQLTKDLIAANAEIAGIFTGHMMNVFAAVHGINGNNGVIYGRREQNVFEAARMNMEVTGPIYNEKVEEFKRRVAEAYEREAQRKLATYKADLVSGFQRQEVEIERQNDPVAQVKLTSITPSLYAREAILKVREIIGNNQEKYQQHRDLIDKVYSEYFRCLDTISDISGDTLAMQQGVDEYNVANRTKQQSAIMKVFERMQQSQESKYNLILARAEALRSIVDHYLRGREMTATAQEVLKEFTTQQQGSQDTQTN